MELGIYSFGDTGRDSRSGEVIDPERRLKNLLEEIELADAVGLDVFGLGEHHREDYAIPSPAIALAAAATRTHRIRLTSAVTVLSSADPVRTFQDFAMLDLISGGRAEIMAGRGAFTESFPLFGYALEDYEAVFDEHLDLLLKIREEGPVHWSGRHRSALRGTIVYPRPLQHPLPIWAGVGGTPQSVARAAMLGLPMALSIIGGDPERVVPLVDFYRETFRRSGHDPKSAKVAITSHGFVAENMEAAVAAFYPYYAELMSERFRERGWPPVTRAQFDLQTSQRGAMIIGSPQDVADKILHEHRLFAHDRFLLQPSMGTMPHEAVLRAIELFGTEVAPVVRKALASSRADLVAPAAAAE